ncbi:HEAT repeat domain-containing protein, partial [Pedosphaera parvula]
FDQVRLKALCELTPTNTPETSVPLLIQGLADPSPMNRSIVASKLCKFGTNALPAVPALVPLAAMSATNPGYGPARHALIVLDRATAAKVLTNGPWTYERFTNRMGMMKNRRLQEFKKSVSRGSVDGSQTN